MKRPLFSQFRLSVASAATAHTDDVSENQRQPTSRFARARGIAVGVGVAAIVTAAVLTAAQRDDVLGTADLPMAGSGSAPVNTSYTPPVVGDMTAMNTGATVVDTTTPPTTLPTTKAEPAIKAGK